MLDYKAILVSSIILFAYDLKFFSPYFSKTEFYVS